MKNDNDNQKMFIPPLAIENDFFRSAFVNPCMMYNQRRSQSAVRLPAHLPIECLTLIRMTKDEKVVAIFKGLML